MNKSSDADVGKVYVYCRVSGDRQVNDGDGLGSQETRCLRFAESQGLKVDRVFKEAGLSGALRLEDRPKLRALCEEVEKQRAPCVVIVDDISRLARDVGVYTELRLRLRNSNATLMAPNIKFGDGPEEQMFENLSMAFAQYHRQSNARQVKSRQKARLENGFWPFHAPLGYRQVKDVAGGKVLERVEPMATVIASAFEGFAVGRLETQAQVADFLARSGAFPCGKKGRFHPSRAKAILTNTIYTGNVEFPKWDVALRAGRHQPIIDMRTFHKVQERMGLRAKAPYRKDLREDFPLRGFVLCAACNDPLTASWSRARNRQKHAYYHCKRRTCRLYGKSIRRNEIEAKLEDLLQKITPSEAVLTLAEEVVRDVHRKLRGEHTSFLNGLHSEIKEVERQKNGFMERLLKTEDREMIALYERHVKELEQKRLTLMEEACAIDGANTGIEGALGTVFSFMGNPHAYWKNGGLEERRLVLRLVFAKQLPFDKEGGFGTAATSLPFTVFSDLEAKREVMVDREGFEPSYS